MADAVICRTPTIGVDFHRRTTTAEHGLGTQVVITSSVNPGYNGRLAIYVKASGVIANSSYVTVDLSTVSCLATSVDTGATGTALYRNGSVAFADLEFGWVMGLRRYPAGAL